MIRPELIQGKSYLIRYVLDPDRKNSKLLEARVQILDVRTEHGVTTVSTNRRPWGEGGTGSMFLEQIREAYEIEKGGADR